MTPMVRQYLEIKRENQDAILFYRMGDFYEMFFEDALTGSEVLGITLTRRGQHKAEDIPLAGFPYHALEVYLHKMLQAGYKVAVCEQVEDPALAKGVVKREVVEVFTRGTDLSNSALLQTANNYIVSLYHKGDLWSAAWMDVTTGEFVAAELPEQSLLVKLSALSPVEYVICHGQEKRFQQLLPASPIPLARLESWFFEHQFARNLLLDHFAVRSLKGFGLEEKLTAIIAAGAVLHYVRDNLKRPPRQVQALSCWEPTDYLKLDPTSRRNLELVEPLSGGDRRQTLFAVMDRTLTPMGRRLLHRRLQEPLLNISAIEQRLDYVETALTAPAVRGAIRNLLRNVIDLEHLTTKISSIRANARDLTALATMLEVIPELQEQTLQFDLPAWQEMAATLDPLPELRERIRATLLDDPPAGVREGGMVRSGFHPRLDELHGLASSGKTWLDEFASRERETTGISSLKVKSNKVFGYYIEVSNPNLERVPANYIRKQTLVNAERFITPELKEYEERIYSARDEIESLEYEIFQQLLQNVQQEIAPIQSNAALLARIDLHTALAVLAEENRYHRPHLGEDGELSIKEGRHPVVEKLLPVGDQFVPNDVELENNHRQILLITGPNMAGKSTYLRMVGLIVLMGQMGSFVPAAQVHLGLVDRIFTRVGASDNLARGESTFLVEMNEAANILNNATSRSLILLDEIGRGTSTFDGLSLAWAITEYLHNQEKVRANTLFATHYHELVDLEQTLPRLRNVNIQVKEYGGKLVFLRKIVPGGCSHSYGIDVARMAGIPQTVIERAREVLRTLEQTQLTSDAQPRLAVHHPPATPEIAEVQPQLFEEEEQTLLDEVLQQKLDRMTPLEGMLFLDRLQRKIRRQRKRQ
ncbi:MAG: DNA mismatch repair protein MutS [Candidatus Delongbacteria bacterium]|nr:DNA mismatch repair protein MutS [Candidatus Delongbacteria bacterium]